MGCILIVEDNKHLADALTIVLSRDYNVEVADSIAQARETVTKFTPDLVVLDLMLPNGYGADLLKNPKIQQALVIVFTARELKPQEIADLIEQGVTAVLKKPASLTVLRAYVKKALALRKPPPPQKRFCSISSNLLQDLRTATDRIRALNGQA